MSESNPINNVESSLSIDRNLIFDVGMHIGQDTKYYLEKGFRVVAVEANPLLAREASIRFKDYIDMKRLVIVNMGISARESSGIPFYVNKTYSEWSSFILDIGSRGGSYETISVDVTTAPSLFKQYRCPYYMKIDIEGLDQAVITSLRNTSPIPRYISAENGQESMIRELSKLGYKSFKFINQAGIGGRHCISPSKEGKTIDYIFSHGASGEFGEDSPGDWMCMESVIKISNQYWNNSPDPNVHGWYDVHARLD